MTSYSPERGKEGVADKVNGEGQNTPAQRKGWDPKKVQGCFFSCIYTCTSFLLLTLLSQVLEASSLVLPLASNVSLLTITASSALLAAAL